ncbi:hypothetical protein [Streptomyces sp. NPDC047000]|uniref:hypothetical protein n=1 Tax=Streptomyces sp. NPDC047000 TaxID=3155474 RepID=UPI0033D08DB1
MSRTPTAPRGVHRRGGRPSRRCPSSERRLPAGRSVCFNGSMASFQKDTTPGRHDLEPFWPSRQHHDYDRLCCRAMNARAL